MATYENYEHLIKKYIGLLGQKVKLPIRDVKALSLVYTPGVAASCLEIQKHLDDSFKYTNKLNSMLIITDSSAGNFNREKWNDQAPIPYLEGIACMYKKLANIDCYPLIIQKGQLKDGEELAQLITKITPAFSAVEFYNMDADLIKSYYEHRAKIEEKINAENTQNFLSYFYATLDSKNKETLEKDQGLLVSGHLIYAAALRVALDTQSYINLNDVVEVLITYAKNNFDLTHNRVFSCMTKLIEVAYDFLEQKKVFNLNVSSHYIEKFELNKSWILSKYEKYITEGENGWTCNFPKGYITSKHNVNENSNLLHQRHKGIVSTSIKIPFQSVEEMLRVLSFENFEIITQKIIENPAAAKEYTSHGNLGAIITNGTAILGLGHIGALAGLPVMEGKSVLFKLFGGTDIVPFCINELDQEKFVRIVELISPIYSIINLEDIKSPECFFIEPTLDNKLDYPVFHDDQHGTAIVTLAGVINALRLSNKKIDEIKVVMNGAGAAGLSVAELLITYGVKNFIVCDTKGAIHKERKENMNEFKRKMAAITNHNNESGKLVDIIKGADVFVGLSAGGELTKDMVRSMNTKPIIFALANPTPEIYPDEAIEAGAFIVATGRSDFPNQINNSMAFPGIFRAAVDIGAKHIDMKMKIAAAEGIANSIPENQITVERIVPNSMDTVIAITVATSVAKTAEKEGLIRKAGVTSEYVKENIDAWFHEGDLRVNL